MPKRTRKQRNNITDQSRTVCFKEWLAWFKAKPEYKRVHKFKPKSNAGEHIVKERK